MANVIECNGETTRTLKNNHTKELITYKESTTQDQFQIDHNKYQSQSEHNIIIHRIPANVAQIMWQKHTRVKINEDGDHEVISEDQGRREIIN